MKTIILFIFLLASVAFANGRLPACFRVIQRLTHERNPLSLRDRLRLNPEDQKKLDALEDNLERAKDSGDVKETENAIVAIREFLTDLDFKKASADPLTLLEALIYATTEERDFFSAYRNHYVPQHIKIVLKMLREQEFNSVKKLLDLRGIPYKVLKKENRSYLEIEANENIPLVGNLAGRDVKVLYDPDPEGIYAGQWSEPDKEITFPAEFFFRDRSRNIEIHELAHYYGSTLRMLGVPSHFHTAYRTTSDPISGSTNQSGRNTPTRAGFEEVSNRIKEFLYYRNRMEKSSNLSEKRFWAIQMSNKADEIHKYSTLALDAIAFAEQALVKVRGSIQGKNPLIRVRVTSGTGVKVYGLGTDPNLDPQKPLQFAIVLDRTKEMDGASSHQVVFVNGPHQVDLPILHPQMLSTFLRLDKKIMDSPPGAEVRDSMTRDFDLFSQQILGWFSEEKNLLQEISKQAQNNSDLTIKFAQDPNASQLDLKLAIQALENIPLRPAIIAEPSSKP